MAQDSAYLDQCFGEISKLRREFGEVAKACIYSEEDLTWLAPSTLSPAEGRTTPFVSMDSTNSPMLQARVEQLEIELRRKDDQLSCYMSQREPSADARSQFELRRQVEELQELLEFCRREKEIAVQTLEEKLSDKSREVVAAEERLRTAREEFSEALQSAEASNQRTRKQLQDLMASHRKLESAIKMLTAKSEPGPAEVPVDQLMDDLKVKVITLDKRIASVIANIGCWADKEHVLQRAFSEVKRLVIELKGSEPTETCWDLSPSCFVDIPSRTRHGILKALQELVVAWDMLPASGSRYNLPLCQELATNGDYLKRLASEIRRADTVAAVATKVVQMTAPACAARSRTPINSPGEKPRPTTVTSPAVLRRNKLAAQTTPKKATQREAPPLSSRLLHPSLLPHMAVPSSAEAPPLTPAPLNFACVTPEPEQTGTPVAFRSISNPAAARTQPNAQPIPLRPVPRTRSPASSRSSSPSLSTSRPGRGPPSVSSTMQGSIRHGGRAAEDATRQPVTAPVVPAVSDRL